ncbi:2S albumin-like [Chenopodium quinoa]|uniref:2S albumin-like n=1 Tax=Chenopodium quinoa TaxID=63459 RepID=UPI000B79861A|nr:2S albumin-like [Chenopodium quinoa]
MAKTLSLLLATIATTLIVISTFKTTGATIANEARLSSQCERQIRWEKMDHCRQYMRSEMDVLMYPNSGNQACCLRECCEMLQEMDEDCVCEALECVAEEEKERMMRSREGRLMGKVVLRKAMQLPGRCGISTSMETQFPEKAEIDDGLAVLVFD